MLHRCIECKVDFGEVTIRVWWLPNYLQRGGRIFEPTGKSFRLILIFIPEKINCSVSFVLLVDLGPNSTAPQSEVIVVLGLKDEEIAFRVTIAHQKAWPMYRQRSSRFHICWHVEWQSLTVPRYRDTQSLMYLSPPYCFACIATLVAHTYLHYAITPKVRSPYHYTMKIYIIWKRYNIKYHYSAHRSEEQPNSMGSAETDAFERKRPVEYHFVEFATNVQ